MTIIITRSVVRPNASFPTGSHDWIEVLYKKIQTLPATEFNYYLSLLLAAIKNDGATHRHIKLLRKTEALLDTLARVYAKEPLSVEDVVALKMDIEDLIVCSSIHKLPQRIKRGLLHLYGLIIGIATSIFGAAIGLTIGLFSDQNLIGNLSGSCLGFLTGFLMGLLVGYRLPVVALQSPLQTKIEFCMDNLARLKEQITDRPSIRDEAEQTKAYILKTYFKNIEPAQQEAAFQAFLESEQTYQVATTTAGHISPSVKGHLGHHSLIRYKINGISDIPIEFGDRLKTPKF